MSKVWNNKLLMCVSTSDELDLPFKIDQNFILILFFYSQVQISEVEKVDWLNKVHVLFSHYYNLWEYVMMMQTICLRSHSCKFGLHVLFK